MNPQSNPKPVVIVVDGVIAAGKSQYLLTVSEGLSNTTNPRTGKPYRVVLVKEPVDKWKETGILQRFYNDTKRWAYHFQTTAFHDRVKANVDAYQQYGDDVDVYILERSFVTDTIFMDMLHDSGMVDDLEYADYRQWWDMWSMVMPYTPDLFVYLRPDIDVCMARLKERSRDGESGVTKEYQEALLKKHDELFGCHMVSLKKDGVTTRVPAIVLDTNENFRDNHEVKEKVVCQFISFIDRIWV